MQDDEFRASMRQSVEMSNEARTFSEENWRTFAGKLSYLSGDLDSDDTYTQLAEAAGGDALGGRQRQSSVLPLRAGLHCAQGDCRAWAKPG